jgi:hypothetical protein
MPRAQVTVAGTYARLCICIYKTPNITSSLQENDMDSLVAHSRQRQFEVQRDMSSKALADRFQLEQEVQRLQQKLNAVAEVPAPTPTPTASPAIEFIEVMFRSCKELNCLSESFFSSNKLLNLLFVFAVFRLGCR